MISFGFSPCPNDTMIFGALACGKVSRPGFEFEFTIDDVESLNNLALAGHLQVSKVSCHAYCHLRESYTFLNCGGAFGRGCGPLIVARDKNLKINEKTKIAAPGRYTTAALLLSMYLDAEYGIEHPDIIHMPFNEIMSAVSEGRADLGLIIHESRFTYQRLGLSMIADLGAWWEKETGLPIPLGGIAAAKNLGSSTIQAIEELIRKSLRYGLENRAEAMRYIKLHAQELDEDVISSHINLYVNDYTLDMGADGTAALYELTRRFNNMHRKARP